MLYYWVRGSVLRLNEPRWHDLFLVSGLINSATRNFELGMKQSQFNNGASLRKPHYEQEDCLFLIVLFLFLYQKCPPPKCYFCKIFPNNFIQESKRFQMLEWMGQRDRRGIIGKNFSACALSLLHIVVAGWVACPQMADWEVDSSSTAVEF